MTGEQRAGWISRIFGNSRVKLVSTASPDERPTPLTRDRVAAYLRRRGYKFVVDAEGDLTGTWDDNRFWFLLLGDHEEILQIRGRWHRQLPAEQRRALGLALNDWNRERIWPKVYLREEEGELALYSEVSIDLERGVTESQLAQAIACGLGTGVKMFDSLAGLLPPGTDTETTD